MRPVICALVILSLGGCNTMPILGGAGGAAACYKLFKDKSYQKQAAAVCGAVGVLAGNALSKYLNEREKAQLAQATNKTLTTGERQVITTEEGNTIITEAVKPATTAATVPPVPTPQIPSSKQPVKKPPQTRAARPIQPTPTPPISSPAPVPVVVADSNCGTVKQTVITKDNQRHEDTISACKKGDTWVAA